MSFILSDTGKKVAVTLKYYPWFLFCLSCSDISISAVTAFPKSLCFISKHRQLLHKICIALVAFFWLFNWSSLKLGAQNFGEVVCKDCAFSMQCRMENKQEVSMRYLFFLFLLFSLPRESALITGIPALCFPQSCCFAVCICFDAGLCSLCHLNHLECGWGRVMCGKWYEIGYRWGRWTNFSVWCELGSAVFEFAVCFKLDSAVVPDLCVLAHHSMLCVSPAPAVHYGMPTGASSRCCPRKPRHSCDSPLPSCLSMLVNCCFGFNFLKSCPGHLSFPQFFHLGFLGCISQSHVAVSRLYTKCVSLVLLS